MIVCLVSVLGLGLYWYLRPTQVVGIEQAAQSADSALPPLASPGQPLTQRSGSAEAPSAVPAHPQVGVSSSSPSLNLRVVSRSSSMGIANARVEEVQPAGSEEPARLAVTDSDGRCTFVRPTSSLATPCSVAVSAAGFATKELQLPSTPGTQTPAPQEVLIELQPEGVIAGSVVCDGRIPSDRLTVFAWRHQRNLSSSDVAAVSAGRASWNVHLAQSDGQGQFQLRGLDPDQRYNVLALGAGYWGQSASGPYAPGTHDAVCRVQAAYGLIVRVDIDTQAARAPDEHVLAVGPSWTEAPDGTEPWALLDAERQLWAAVYGDAALADVPSQERGSWKTSLLLFLREGEGPAAIGPLEFEVQPPGCAPVKAALTIPRLGPTGPQRVRLTTSGLTCAGELRLVPVLGSDANWNARAQVRLQHSVTGEVLLYALNPYRAEQMYLRGLPCGAYDLRIQADHTFVVWPAPGREPVQIHIQNGETTSVNLDAWQGLGSAEVELIDQHGQPYTDSVVVDFEWEYQGAYYSRNSLHLDHPPFRCALLPAANWAARVRVADSAVQILEPRTLFTVVSGQTTKVAVPIQR